MTEETIKSFLGKECLIYMLNNQMTGTIESLSDNWLSVRVGDAVDIVNVEYISRIREYPRTRSGKKRSIIAD